MRSAVLRILRRPLQQSLNGTKNINVISSVRAFSTSSTAVTIPTANSVPANPNIKSIRKELVRSLDADVSELTSAQDEGLLQYIKDSKFRILHNTESNSVVVSRAVGDTLIEARFEIEPDQDENEEVDENEEEEENEEQEQEKEKEEDAEEQEEEDVTLDRHTIRLIVSKLGSAPAEGSKFVPNTISVDSHVDSRGFFHIDSITTDVLPTSLGQDSLHPLAVPAKQPETLSLDMDGDDMVDTSMQFNELGDATKDHFYRYLEALGIDDQFGQFVQHYAQVIRTQIYTKRMQQLRSFLSQ